MNEETKQKIIEQINSKYPLQMTDVENITGGMYRCTSNDGVYFARITNYKPFEVQAEETAWTEFLHDQALGVAAIVKSLQNKRVETIELGDEVLTVLFKAAPGIHLPRAEWTAPILKKLGQQIGRMHRLTKQFVEQQPVRHLPSWLDHGDYNFSSHIPEEETVIREVAEQVVSAIKAIPKTPENYGLIHGDIWLENVLVSDAGELSFIDFQDCERHYYIYDLAVPLFSAFEFSFAGGGNLKDYRQSLMNALIEGYQEENTLPDEMLAKLPLFMKLKELFEYSMMHRFWDKDQLTEEQVRIFNHYRFRLEGDGSPVTHI